MENIKFKPNLFRRVVAFVLAMTMCLSLGITYTFAADVTKEIFGYTVTYNNELASATTATINDNDFEFIYDTSTGTAGFNDGAYIQAKDASGSMRKDESKNSTHIVDIKKGYVKFTPKKAGTLKLNINNGSTATKKLEFGVNKEVEGELTILGWFITGYTKDDSIEKNLNDNVKVTKDDSELPTGKANSSDVEITMEANQVYYFALDGSKLKINSMSFVPEGGVTPPTPEDTTVEENTEKDTEAPTEKDTEAPTEKDTEAPTEKDTEASTEGSTEAPLALGNVDGSADGKITANDASMVLQYVLDKVNHKLSPSQLAAAEVSGDNVITAMDAAQILNKSIDPSYVFTKNNSPSVETTEKPTEKSTTEETTAEAKTEDSTTEPDTTEPGPAPSDNPTLWVLGDSTVCNYTTENVEGYNFRQGWGMRLEDYVDTSKITIKNLARSGRSARDFYLYEGGAPYAEYTNGLKAGDYVLIQFGHNDEKDLLKAWNSSGLSASDQEKFDAIPENQRVEITQELKDSTNTQASVGQIATVDGNYGKREGGIGGAAGLDWETKADENGYVAVDKIISVPGTASEGGKVPSFEWYYFNKYIKPAQDEGATVILVTPIVRLQGAPKDTNDDGVKEVADISQHTNNTWKTTGISGMNYVAAIKKLADDKGLKYIDLTALSQEYWNKIFKDKLDSGATETEAYDYARKLLHAYNKGDGKTTDKTHLSKNGAAAAAKLVTDSVREQNLPLAEYLKPAE